MKRALSILGAAIILVSFVCNVFALNAPNKIYANEVVVESGESVTIPVKIENNEGFMGFAIFVTYDKDVFTPVSVTKGSCLSGLFNDSIATSKTNTFKVVCSETSNVTDDGVLFNLKFDVNDNVSGKYEIELSYSQQDTFNENWDNVVFACEDIEVVATENGTTAPTTTTTTTVATTTTTTKVTTTVPSTATTAVYTTQPVTTKPIADETTTQPASAETTDPVDEPDDKPLSVIMKEWVNGLPTPLNIVLGIFVTPLAFFISLFE